MMPATEPLQVGVVVVVSVLNVVTVCTLGNASRAVVHDGFALSARSGFNNSPSLRPVAGQAFASVRGCPRHDRHLLILGTHTLCLLPEVAGVGALSNPTTRIWGTAPLHACLGRVVFGFWVCFALEVVPSLPRCYGLCTSGEVVCFVKPYLACLSGEVAAFDPFVDESAVDAEDSGGF